MLDIDRVKKLAKEKGVSHTFLCKKLGRTSATLFVDWGAGKSKPTDSDIENLAELLQTSVDYLTGKTDIKNRPSDLDDLSDDALRIAKLVSLLSSDRKRQVEEYIQFLEQQDL